MTKKSCICILFAMKEKNKSFKCCLKVKNTKIKIILSERIIVHLTL